MTETYAWQEDLLMAGLPEEMRQAVLAGRYRGDSPVADIAAIVIHDVRAGDSDTRHDLLEQQVERLTEALKDIRRRVEGTETAVEDLCYAVDPNM